MTEGKRLILAVYGSWRVRRELARVFQTWWQQCETLAATFGLTLDHIAGSFRQRTSLKRYQDYRISRSGKRFREEVARGNVEYLELLAMNRRPKGYLTLDWDACFALGEDPVCGVISLVGIAVQYLKKKTGTEVLGLLGELVAQAKSRLKILYGFATVMPRNFMPSGYASGLASAGAPSFLVKDANVWMDSAGLSCDRVLRNVFGYNLLTADHLLMRVGKESLLEWINASEHRGTWSELGEKVYSWVLEPSPESIAFLDWDAPRVRRVRKELEAYSIFPWQNVED